MAKQTINIGASPNDGTGTPLRTSFDYTNQNFTELYTALGGGVGLPGATTQVIFNDGGTNLAGDAGLVYNKTTDALTVAGLVTAGSTSITGAATVGTTLGVTGVSTLASAVVTGDLTVDTSTLKVDSTNDRVGIGTASPAVRLHVNAGNGNQLVLSNAGEQFTLIEYRNSTTGKAQQYWDNTNSIFENYLNSTGAFTWKQTATELMRLNSTGLGIGVAPVTGAKLAVAGPIVRNKGTVTATISVATTFATLPGEGLYIVYAYTNASNPNAFTSYAVILADSSGSRVVANNGTQITITTSTFALEVTQIFFPSVTILWSYVQIG